MITRHAFTNSLDAQPSKHARMDYVCRVLGVILSATGEDIEVTHIGDGEITFHTYTKQGVKVIQRALKPFFTKGTLNLTQIRKYEACEESPESYLVCVVPA
jgi:hypothetical protein